jgi:hypothetical protein
MIFETNIKELSDRYLADVRRPDITGFVDQLFRVAAETGTVACVFKEDKRLQFFVHSTPVGVMGSATKPTQAPPTCIVEHEAARGVLRMICARLGTICKERTAKDISLYGDKAVIDYTVEDRKSWSVSFTNTPERQEFLIEAL